MNSLDMKLKEISGLYLEYLGVVSLAIWWALQAALWVYGAGRWNRRFFSPLALPSDENMRLVLYIGGLLTPEGPNRSLIICQPTEGTNWTNLQVTVLHHTHPLALKSPCSSGHHKNLQFLWTHNITSGNWLQLNYPQAGEIYVHKVVHSSIIYK